MAESGFDMAELSKLPAEQAHKMIYRSVFGKEPDLEAPRTLTKSCSG